MARLMLEALLGHSIDYAGLFPPASLPLSEAVSQFRKHRDGKFAFLLGRFVAGEKDLDAIPPDLDRCLAVLSERDCARASVIETKSVLSLSKPTYCEVAIEMLPAVAEAGSFAKVRIGGVLPEAIPTSDYLAEYIACCGRLRLPFKATAGLHHPLRSMQPLTDGADSLRAVMHGFVNLLVASAFAWQGVTVAVVRQILEETDGAAFQFGDEIHWRDRRISGGEAIAARRDFVHSFGSCSFEDPVRDLQQLGWL